MELRILEGRVRVLSLARAGLWQYTHPLLKLLLLPQRTRCKFFSLTETPEDYTIMLDEEGFKAAAVGVPANGGFAVAGAECLIQWWRVGRRPAHRRHQDRQVGHRAFGATQRLRPHALHLPDRLHPGAGEGPPGGHPHFGERVRYLPRGQRRAGPRQMRRRQQRVLQAKASGQRHRPSGPEPAEPVLHPQRRAGDVARHRHHPPGRLVLLARRCCGEGNRVGGGRPGLLHVLRLLADRGVHLHRDGRRDQEEVSERPLADQFVRRAMEDGQDRRSAPRVRRMWDRGADRRAFGRRGHLRLLHQHLQFRPRFGSRGRHRSRHGSPPETSREREIEPFSFSPPIEDVRAASDAEIHATWAGTIFSGVSRRASDDTH